jgi:hypothetical protein
MADDQEFDINLDIVLCMDATGSMHYMLDKVKASALSFFDNLKVELDAKHRHVEETRIKVIAFRDMTIGEPNEVSGWFNLPAQSADYKAFVDRLVARGGGDGPETAIDALSLAMAQDWVKTGSKRRHVIVLWTDAPTKLPGEQKMDDQLPKTMPEFVKMWQDPQEAKMDPNAKRLAVWAPNDDSWTFVEAMENTSYQEVSPDKELDELSMDLVIKFIAESV